MASFRREVKPIFIQETGTRRDGGFIRKPFLFRLGTIKPLSNTQKHFQSKPARVNRGYGKLLHTIYNTYNVNTVQYRIVQDSTVYPTIFNN